jgi:beta-mannosidase
VVVCNDTLEDATVSYRVWGADDGTAQVEGEAVIPVNQNWQVGRIRTFASEQELYLIEWQVNGQTFGNHYLVGLPPVSLAQYRRWLPLIATLPQPFDPASVAE